MRRYARKILGFAYSKTHNAFRAEDLSQDIMVSLADSLRRQRDIADMDAFVYTVCCYTWSNHLRGNKKHWNNLDVELLGNLPSDQNVEEQAVTALLVEKLRTEIAYLGERHRRITLLFYYGCVE